MGSVVKSGANKLPQKTYLEWYELMLLLRRFEEKAGQMYGMQKIRGFLHLYIGQEAVAAGCVAATRKEDIFITAYRDHGLAIAKGMCPKQCMAELYGKQTGCSRGKGGSMHFFDPANYFYGGNGIVGAQIGTGAGLAWAEKYKGTDNVCLTFFGDGAARQGILHEVFNMAMTWKLPVVFICEDNKYAMGTSVERTSNVVDITKLSLSYDMPSASADGMDPEDVYNVVSKAVAHTRKGKGPYFINMNTYRYRGHSVSDPGKYRTKDEVEKYKQVDPIIEVAEILTKKFKMQESELQAIEDKVVALVQECVDFAENSPFPDPKEVLSDIYVDANYPFIVD